MEHYIKRAVCIAAASFLCFSLSANAMATESIETNCIKEFESAEECQCSIKRTSTYIGGDLFARYDVFFEIFSERASDAETSGEILGAWDGAQGAYAKKSGEEYFVVTGWVREVEAVHRYALKACGIKIDDDEKATSRFFWGEAL